MCALRFDSGRHGPPSYICWSHYLADTASSLGCAACIGTGHGKQRPPRDTNTKTQRRNVSRTPVSYTHLRAHETEADL
eukprot:6070815-Amphidinium_carterae.1